MLKVHHKRWNPTHTAHTSLSETATVIKLS